MTKRNWRREGVHAISAQQGEYGCAVITPIDQNVARAPACRVGDENRVPTDPRVADVQHAYQEDSRIARHREERRAQERGQHAASK